LSVRVKFILVGVLLMLALAATVFAAIATVQAIQGFQQQNSLVRADDVRSVSDWMTIPYIARTYHVPEDYLYQWLHITSVQKPRHATLRLLAIQYHRTVTSMIQSVQSAIRAYRTQHSLTKTYGSVTVADVTVVPLTVAAMVGPGYPQGDTPTIYAGRATVYSRGIPLRVPWHIAWVPWSRTLILWSWKGGIVL